MLEVRLSVAMLSIAGGTYLAGVYGMNVINGLEESLMGFPLTAGGSVVAMICFGIFGIRRVGRISQMLRVHGGERGYSGRPLNGTKRM